MKTWIKVSMATVVAAGLSVGVAWWWVHNMERELVATRIPPTALPDQEFFALKKLLVGQGIAVEWCDHLSQAQAKASIHDAIFLSKASAHFPASLGAPLIAWVEKGGTVVGQTPWFQDSTEERFFHPVGVRIGHGDEDEVEAPVDTAQVATVRNDSTTGTDSVMDETVDNDPELVLPGLPGGPEESTSHDSTDSVTTLEEEDQGELEEKSDDTAKAPPDTGVAIRLPGTTDTLRKMTHEWNRRIYPVPSATVAWHDTLDSAIVVIARGSGYVVAVSDIGLFDSDHFQRLDHAELALRLLSWRQKPAKVWIVRESTVMPWWAWLADRAWAILLVTALFAGLWFWNRVRRFGPLLPDPDTDRRLLLEHIDASARWIWNSPGGPDTLLSALRESVRRHLAVRHPGWVGLSPEELAQELSRLHDLPTAAVRRALDSDNFRQHAPSPQELVRTVKILRKLKERA